MPPKSLFPRAGVAGALALVLAAAFLVYAGPAGARSAGSPAAGGLTAARSGVVVHLFEWTWPDVGRECRQVLGPGGVSAVQVSPPQENILLPERGYPWWQRYQAISYKLQSRGGNRQQFAEMVRTCRQAGVKIYVDAILNHTAGSWPAGTKGAAGSTFSHYEYPGIYSNADFHHCGRNGNDDIANYKDAWEVRNCELVDLADLATEKPAVRNRLAAYLNDLLSLGVAGFRVDAAKHMPVEDLAAIERKLTRPAYIYQEVTYGAGEPIQPKDYEKTGQVQEFRYGTTVGAAFRKANGANLAGLRTVGADEAWVKSAKALTFTDNHDTQRSGATDVTTYKDGRTYTLANVFELAWNYGTPVLMSSYGFDDREAGPPSDSAGHTKPVACGTGWECEHRQPAILGMVGFRNTVAGTPVTNWWSDGGNAIAFGRGSRGFVAINNTDQPVTRTYQTSLPTGRYCDVTHAGDKKTLVRKGTCAGPVFTIDRTGKLTATVASHDTVALHVGQRGR